MNATMTTRTTTESTTDATGTTRRMISNPGTGATVIHPDVSTHSRVAGCGWNPYTRKATGAALPSRPVGRKRSKQSNNGRAGNRTSHRPLSTRDLERAGSPPAVPAPRRPGHQPARRRRAVLDVLDAGGANDNRLDRRFLPAQHAQYRVATSVGRRTARPKLEEMENRQLLSVVIISSGSQFQGFLENYPSGTTFWVNSNITVPYATTVFNSNDVIETEPGVSPVTVTFASSVSGQGLTFYGTGNTVQNINFAAAGPYLGTTEFGIVAGGNGACTTTLSHVGASGFTYGIYANPQATLNLTDCVGQNDQVGLTVAVNSTVTDTGSSWHSDNIGVTVAGTATLNSDTISSNNWTAVYDRSSPLVTLNWCTITGNAVGGGTIAGAFDCEFQQPSGAVITVNACTITNNSGYVAGIYADMTTPSGGTAPQLNIWSSYFSGNAGSCVLTSYVGPTQEGYLSIWGSTFYANTLTSSNAPGLIDVNGGYTSIDGCQMWYNNIQSGSLVRYAGVTFTPGQFYFYHSSVLWNTQGSPSAPTGPGLVQLDPTGGDQVELFGDLISGNTSYTNGTVYVRDVWNAWVFFWQNTFTYNTVDDQTSYPGYWGYGAGIYVAGDGAYGKTDWVYIWDNIIWANWAQHTGSSPVYMTSNAYASTNGGTNLTDGTFPGSQPGDELNGASPGIVTVPIAPKSKSPYPASPWAQPPISTSSLAWGHGDWSATQYKVSDDAGNTWTYPVCGMMAVTTSSPTDIIGGAGRHTNSGTPVSGSGVPNNANSTLAAAPAGPSGFSTVSGIQGIASVVFAGVGLNPVGVLSTATNPVTPPATLAGNSIGVNPYVAATTSSSPTASRKAMPIVTSANSTVVNLGRSAQSVQQSIDNSLDDLYGDGVSNLVASLLRI